MDKPVFLLKPVHEDRYLEYMKNVAHYKYRSYYSEFDFTMQDLLDKCPKDIPLKEIILSFDCGDCSIKLSSKVKVPADPERYLKDKREYDEKYNQYLEDMIKYNAWKKENDTALKIKYHEEELAKLKEC